MSLTSMPTLRLSLFAAALALAGCGGGGGGSSAGSLSLGITDAPVDDATDVVVEVSGVEIHGAGGTVNVDFDAPRPIHLLTLTDGASGPLLDGYSLPAGHYQWIRLKVNTTGNGDSYVVTSTGTYPITIPSGAQTGLKLVRGFDVTEGVKVHFTVDFDLRKSLVEVQGGKYVLKPVLRIVDTGTVGAIKGDVDPAAYGCAATGNPTGEAVYVYAGRDVTPKEINTLDGTGPLMVAPVRAPDATNGSYHYRAAFLPPGDYTVALTCAAASDLPESTEGSATVAFETPAYNVTVTAGTVVTQSFPAT